MLRLTLPPRAALVDSVVGQASTPDHLTPIIQWIFQRSPFVMWGGVVLAAVVVFLLVRWYRPRRAAFHTWVRTRGIAGKVAVAAGIGFVVLAAASAGYASYQFVETDKRFCNGCHIFVPRGEAWVQPDTGNYSLVPSLEGKHDTLSCHTCHPLNPTKEAVKLIFWMSGVRGDSIPEHARVPRSICEQCHVQGEAKETWKAIAATAGHRTHLESDSLKATIECLTCHARTAHHFAPTKRTCGQSGCHAESQTRIVLGKMAAQDAAATFHCTACHDFTATVPRLATRDSAAGTLRPAIQRCFLCHEMKARLPDFDIARDPHKGTCGMCHNPHTQKTPAEAVQSCATADCHAQWRGEPFHMGVNHRKVAQRCLTCHPPHAARVDVSDCAGCHERVRTENRNLKPPLPFDTLKALQRSLGAPGGPKGERPLFKVLSARWSAPPFSRGPTADRPQKSKRDGPLFKVIAARWSPPFASLPADTFSHDRHKKLACLTCHLAASSARLTFEPPRGCQICHHQAPMRSDCVQCHTPTALATVVSVGPFTHGRHKTLRCLTCHDLSDPQSVLTFDPPQGCDRCHHKDPQTSDCTKCHKEDQRAEPFPAVLTVKVPGKEPDFHWVEFHHDKHSKETCTDCHETPVTLAPPAQVRDCSTCHRRHHEESHNCAACHQDSVIAAAHPQAEQPHLDCDRCHTPATIALLTPSRPMCLTCHGDKADHEANEECTVCHFQDSPEGWRPHLQRGAGG